MKKIVTCSQMKALDEHTIQNMGVPSLVLMERAALKVTEEIKKRLAGQERILVACGSGNNGGDGIAVARLLFLSGVRTEIFLAGNPEKMTRETALQWKIAGNYHVPVTNNPKWDEYTTIVDAVFGVGLSRNIEGKYADVIAGMNASPAKKVAVDIPSGVSTDTGSVLGIAFRADLTVTFAYRKRGLCFYPGRMYAGETVVADIGIYDREETEPGDTAHKEETAFYMEPGDLARLPRRVPYGNKGTFGKVLVVAGSKGMCGAAYLAAAAALRAGAGMVKIQTVEENRLPLQTLLPEAMVTCRFDFPENEKNLDWCDVLVVGPGLGIESDSRERAQWFLAYGSRAGKPLILDADGLNLLAAHPAWKEYLNENVVVTPHIGEMSRLCQAFAAGIQADPAAAAVRYAQETGAVCVLKDACTTIADKEGRLFLNLSGNAGMATAGSGDVLSGILAAVFCMYLTQEEPVKPIEKAALAVCLHGLCGDAAALRKGRRGMKAGDLIEALPQVLMEAENKKH